MRATHLALALTLTLLSGCPHDLTRTVPTADLSIHELGGADLGDSGAEAWLDACVPSNGGVEACDGKDNDCDGKVDEGFDLKTDPKNCGTCGFACETPNATAACISGACAVGACSKDSAGNTTHWNTDNDWVTGCDYACKITSGGHEVCDAKDNDCDKQKDEFCASLNLLYRFGDQGTNGNWPTVHNLAGNHSMGLATNGAMQAKGATVKAEGSDDTALSLNGIDGQVTITPTRYQQVFDCDTTTGWAGFANSPSLDYYIKREGTAAMRITGKTNSLGNLIQYTGIAKDLSQWKNSKQELDGYLTFWVFIDDPSHSKLAVMEIGNMNNAQNAAWWNVESHVLGPQKSLFTKGWNLVALPFASAIYADKAKTNWSNVIWVQIYTNVKNDNEKDNFFIFDDFRVEEDLTQRFTRFTVMAWVQPSAIQGRVYVFHKQDDWPGIGTDLTGKQWWFTVGDGVNLYSPPLVKAGSWTHLALTYDGTYLTGYVNGKSVTQTKTNFIPGGRTRIGADNVAGRFFPGKVDEVAIYSRAMGLTELQRYVGFFSP